MRSSNVIFAAFAFTIALIGSSCSMSAAGVEVVDSSHSSFITETDPELHSALALIDKVPDSKMAYNNLAILYIKRARNTGDFGYYSKAEAAVDKALQVDPADGPARKLKASLFLTNHRFDEALDHSLALDRQFPNDAFIKGVLTDAHMELGNYPEAIAAAQQMVDIRPDSLSYSRVAQLRSLHGDSAGAIRMMKLAAKTADPADKTLQSWCLVQLGDEHWKAGKYTEAETIYDEALATNPGYFLALVSKGRLRASTGDFTAAEAYLKEAQTLVPNANATHLLADIYSLTGRSEPATAEYAKFDKIQTELGTGADHKKLILSKANRGMTAEALEMALEEYAAEKNIHSAELVAWTFYKAGRANEATPYIREAMRLNTIDARLLFHAGMIARANGNNREAKRLLDKALSQNQGFDLLEAQEARRVLTEMSKR
ncbi:MAG: tetratricopeptide repeat protein [Pyrinomonadaceae bacterium]